MHQVVAFAGALADAGEHRIRTRLLGDVVDQLLDEHRLADAGAAEEADLAALAVWREQVDDLNPGLEHFDANRLVDKFWRRAVNWRGLGRAGGATLVNGFADDVQDAAEDFFANRHRDG